MIKNIVFDLGGVVVDFDPVRIKNEYRGDWSMPQFLFESGFFQTEWGKFDRGTYSQEDIIERMATLSGHPLKECRDFILFVRNSLVDIPKTVSLIKELKKEGFNLYCLSNMSIEYYDYLKNREVFSYFDGQIISGMENVIKPEAAIFRLLSERFNLVPRETLFVDDLPSNTEAARAEGLQTVDFGDKEKGYAQINLLLNRRE